MKKTSPLFKSFGKILGSALCLIAFQAMMPSLSATVLVLGFDDGNGSSSVDQFVGASGSGWSSAWVTKSSSALISTGSTTVVNTTPLYVGGGNYLRAGISTPGSQSGSFQLAYNRKLDSTAISLTQAITYSFYFRPENNISEDASYVIFSRVAGTGSTASGTDANDTWAITTNVTNKTWQLQNGSGSVDTGMSITAGIAYQFTINSDPTSNTYTVSISNGTTTYTSLSLGYRNATNTEGEYLGFGVKDSTGATASNFYFDLDNLSVSQVPEPGTVALAMSALGLVILLRIRKRVA